MKRRTFVLNLVNLFPASVIADEIPRPDYTAVDLRDQAVIKTVLTELVENPKSPLEVRSGPRKAAFDFSHWGPTYKADELDLEKLTLNGRRLSASQRKSVAEAASSLVDRQREEGAGVSPFVPADKRLVPYSAPPPEPGEFRVVKPQAFRFLAPGFNADRTVASARQVFALGA